jgi:hypothetical protein
MTWSLLLLYLLFPPLLVDIVIFPLLTSTTRRCRRCRCCCCYLHRSVSLSTPSVVMARVGEGDSRWIVHDIGSTNVNAWHWEEKNCTPWSHDWLKRSLVNLSLLASDSATIAVSEVAKVEGDVGYCQRKGKNLFLFEIYLKLTWKGMFYNQPTNQPTRTPVCAHTHRR